MTTKYNINKITIIIISTYNNNLFCILCLGSAPAPLYMSIATLRAPASLDTIHDI